MAYEVTFKLKNREKLFTADTVDSAYEKFLKEYGEVLNELEHVTVDCSIIGKSAKFSAKSFKKEFKHVEDDYNEQLIPEKMYSANGVAVERDLQNGDFVTIAMAESTDMAEKIAKGLNWLSEMEEADQIEREGEEAGEDN
jgi:hypothetical protein